MIKDKRKKKNHALCFYHNIIIFSLLNFFFSMYFWKKKKKVCIYIYLLYFQIIQKAMIRKENSNKSLLMKNQLTFIRKNKIKLLFFI